MSSEWREVKVTDSNGNLIGYAHDHGERPTDRDDVVAAIQQLIENGKRSHMQLLNEQLYAAGEPRPPIPAPSRWERLTRRVTRYLSNLSVALRDLWSALCGHEPRDDSDGEYW